MEKINRIINPIRASEGVVKIYNAYALKDLKNYTVIYSINTGYDPVVTMVKCGDKIRVLNNGISEFYIDSLTSDSKTAKSFEYTVGGVYRECDNVFTRKDLKFTDKTFCHLMDEDEVIFSGTLDEIFNEFGNSLIRKDWYRIVDGE